MTQSQQRLLSQLTTSDDNGLASGLGQCLEALRLLRASPIFVKYTSTTSPTAKAFGREHLSCVPLRVHHPSPSLDNHSPPNPPPLSPSDRDRTDQYFPPGPHLRHHSPLLPRDGTIDLTPVLVDEDSWNELVPYVHALHVEDDLERPSTALSSSCSRAFCAFLQTMLLHTLTSDRDAQNKAIYLLG